MLPAPPKPPNLPSWQGSGRVPYRDSKLPGAMENRLRISESFPWVPVMELLGCYIYHSCGYHSRYIMIDHDISILTIMVTQSLHTIPRIFGNFCERLAEVLWCQHGQRKTGIWYCNAAKWHWIYFGDPVRKMNMPRRNNSSGQFGSTADPITYFNSQTSFWVPDFEKVTCNDLATYSSNCPWNIQDSTFGRGHFWISCRDMSRYKGVIMLNIYICCESAIKCLGVFWLPGFSLVHTASSLGLLKQLEEYWSLSKQTWTMMIEPA